MGFSHDVMKDICKCVAHWCVLGCVQYRNVWKRFAKFPIFSIHTTVAKRLQTVSIVNAALGWGPFSTANTRNVLLNVCSVCSTERLFATNIR